MEKKLGEEEAEQLLPVTGKKEIRQSTKQNQKMCQTIAKVAKWSEQKEEWGKEDDADATGQLFINIINNYCC